MLDAVIRFSLRSRLLVLVVSLALLVCGGYLATLMPIDVFPDLDRPRVVIITECPGLATEEVETLVTQPIEVALLGASGVEAVRSQSTAGLTVIYVEFNWDVDIRAARQAVQERLTTVAGVLPPGIRPQLTPTASIMGQIVIAGLFRQGGPRGGVLAAVPGTWQLKVESRLDTSRNPQQTHTRYTTTLDWEALKALRNTIEQALRSKTPDQESGLTLGAAPSQVLQPPMAP